MSALDVTQALGFLDPDARRDPYPYYDRIRAAGLVGRAGDPLVLTADYEQCAAALRAPWASVDRSRSARLAELRERLPPQHRELLERNRPFLFLDPPDHTRLRRLVSRAFTRRRVDALRPAVERTCADLLAAATPASSGALDIIDAVAYPLPVAVICELLGVPFEDRGRFTAWSQALARSLDAALLSRPDSELAEQFEASVAMRAYLGDLAERRREKPTDDLISALVEQADDQDALTTDELLTTLTLLLVAGHETTVGLIGNAVVALARNPGVLARLAAGTETTLAARVVEETLRFDPPVQLTARLATETATVAGVELPEDTLVMLVLAGANRDPQLFGPDAGRFDPDREGAERHLSFSAGAHFCLGAPLARLEAETALCQLAAALPGLTLAGPDDDLEDSVVLRRRRRLLVRPA